MDSNIKGLTDGVADADLPLGGRIAMARDGIAALERKITTIAAEQAELAARIERGEPVTADLEQQDRELRKLRAQTERKLLLMQGFAAKLESEPTA